MPLLKLAETTVLYQPLNTSKRSNVRPGAVRVACLEDLSLRRQFEWEAPIATYMCRSDDEQALLAALMMVFRILTVEFGVDPRVVDAAFMEVKEYRNATLGGF